MFASDSDPSSIPSSSSTASGRTDSEPSSPFFTSRRRSRAPVTRVADKKAGRGGSDGSSTPPPGLSTQEPDEGEARRQMMRRLQRDYEKGRVDFPPCREDGPQVLVIIDTNLKSEEYREYFARIRRINKEVANMKRRPGECVWHFETDDVEEIYDFCLKNIDVLRTYNGHPSKIRFLTNSNRASSCVGRQADPTEAGNSFVRYVREELGLEDAPILIYYFSNVSCLRLRDEAHNVFCTNQREIAEPYIVHGKLPK